MSEGQLKQRGFWQGRNRRGAQAGESCEVGEKVYGKEKVREVYVVLLGGQKKGLEKEGRLLKLLNLIKCIGNVGGETGEKQFFKWPRRFDSGYKKKGGRTPWHR